MANVGTTAFQHSAFLAGAEGNALAGPSSIFGILPNFAGGSSERADGRARGPLYHARLHP